MDILATPDTQRAQINKSTKYDVYSVVLLIPWYRSWNIGKSVLQKYQVLEPETLVYQYLKKHRLFRTWFHSTVKGLTYYPHHMVKGLSLWEINTLRSRLVVFPKVLYGVILKFCGFPVVPFKKWPSELRFGKLKMTQNQHHICVWASQSKLHIYYKKLYHRCSSLLWESAKTDLERIYEQKLWTGTTSKAAGLQLSQVLKTKPKE